MISAHAQSERYRQVRKTTIFTGRRKRNIHASRNRLVTPSRQGRTAATAGEAGDSSGGGLSAACAEDLGRSATVAADCLPTLLRLRPKPRYPTGNRLPRQ